MKGSLPPNLLTSRRGNRKAMGGKQNVLWQQEMFSLNGSSASLKFLISKPSSSFFESSQVPVSYFQGKFSTHWLLDDLYPWSQ